MIIISSLGQTDCERSRFFRRSNKIFAQQVRVPGEMRAPQFVSLPILVAVLASAEAADEAILRIIEARKLKQMVVDLTDLEETEGTL